VRSALLLLLLLVVVVVVVVLLVVVLLVVVLLVVVLLLVVVVGMGEVLRSGRSRGLLAVRENAVVLLPTTVGGSKERARPARGAHGLVDRMPGRGARSVHRASLRVLRKRAGPLAPWPGRQHCCRKESWRPHSVSRTSRRGIAAAAAPASRSEWGTHPRRTAADLCVGE
jgi:hypothetical protein